MTPALARDTSGTTMPTRGSETRSTCVQEVFSSVAEAHPNAVAVIFGAEQLTYGELDARSNQLAHALQERGVGPEVVVGIAVDRARSLDMLISVWAVLKAGGAFLLLNPAPSYPEKKLASLLKEARPRVLVTQAHLVTRLALLAGPAQVLCLDTERAAIARRSTSAPHTTVSPRNLAYLMATSGTTAGEPKVVQVEHHSLANLAAGQIQGFDIEPRDRILQFAAWTFDAVISEIVLAGCSGACLVMGTREVLRPGPTLPAFLSRYRVSVVTLTPSVLMDAQMPESDLAPLRTLILAGEVLPLTVVQRYARPGLRIINAYGPAECTVCLTFGDCTPIIPPDVGFPLPGVELLILDEQLRPVPDGRRGTLYAGGRCLARGYSRPDLTAERFLAHPFVPGQRLYNTGDEACRLPNGRVRVFGRANGDRQVKVAGGRRVQLEEIEAALLQQSSIGSCAVACCEDEGGMKQVVAYIVPAKGAQQTLPTRETLCASLVETGLESYMVPRCYVWLPVLPLGSNDKVDYRSLPLPDGDCLSRGTCLHHLQGSRWKGGPV
jgi:amino acid adenylation domain-containing protein